MTSSNKVLTASCHCHSVQFTINVPITSLPLKVHLCHCSICRHTHGTPCTFHARLPSGVEPQFIPPSGLANLTGYKHATALSTRYFCSTCGCHIGDHIPDDGIWVISNAIFDANKADHGVWKFNTHLYPDSAPDGGLSALVSTVDEHHLELVSPKHFSEPIADVPQGDEANDKELLAQCHCGGVSFHISRPQAEFIASPAGQTWLSPTDQTKWLACMDLCDDCRLVNGTNVIGWMFVPVNHLSPNPSPDLLIGSSKAYRSTADVLRTFCRTCGATVFYSCADRPEIVDIAVGLLKAPEGAMAEDWVLWRAARASWPEDGLQYHAGFSRALIEGMKQWGTERGQLQDFVIP
ncbi:hypothetical protein N7494_008729 [Penicillium frequentans]|uniref:CENP-V/GFA domain-containing protein n=1 Tax=Penicillium frequentans TaxID=3151616 RepID=A0AAD6CPC7_9EURO|nr:hypothetical protein N7494_008729 [Penicillium glabrum]